MRKLVFTIADKWLIFFLLLASLLPIIYNMLYISQPSAKTAQIRVNNQANQSKQSIDQNPAAA